MTVVKTEKSLINIIWTPGQNDTPKMLHVIYKHVFNLKFLFQSLRFPSVIKENKEFTCSFLL